MWEYVKGSEADFEGAPDWATLCGHSYWYETGEKFKGRYLYKGRGAVEGLNPVFNQSARIIAERRKVDNLQSRVNDASLGDALKEMFRDVPRVGIRIGSGVAPGVHSGPVYDLSQSVPVDNKYNRQCKGVTIDVYDVLLAFNVTNPALQHLVKKALCTGLRGHKDKSQDLQDILDSAKRAVELESDK